MTEEEAFKKLVAAYGLKFRAERNKWNTHHYVIFPHEECNNDTCLLSGNGYTATLTPDFNTNLFGNKHECLHSLNEVIQYALGGKLCSKCIAKYRSRLIDYKSLDELDIMLTLAGVNRK